MCQFLDCKSISTSKHHGCEIVYTCWYILDSKFLGAVKDALVGLDRFFELLVIIGNITKFLISINVLRFLFEDFLEGFLSYNWVYVLINACRQFECFNIIGLIVQHFVELLASAPPVFTEDANTTAQHQSWNIGRIKLVYLFCALVSARINLLIQEELSYSRKLLLILFYFGEQLCESLVGSFRIAHLISDNLFCHGLYTSFHRDRAICLILRICGTKRE